MLKYNVDMGYMIGLPARDIGDKEWSSYPKELTEAALKEGLYEPVKEKPEKEVKDA